MNRLQIRNVSKAFEPGHPVLRQINLEAREGNFLVLVGPSGCGKSTLLRLIAGLEEVSAGEVHIDGRMVNEVPPSDRDIAMVFQDYALYPHMTVEESLSFGLRIRRLNKTEIKARVNEVSSMLGIEELLRRKPVQLSGGQRQRVAIGRAIVRQPKLFLFDEPLSNLDAKLRAQMRIEIAALHRKVGNTSVYVTHDQQEAMTLADRIVVLDEGTIQQIGTPTEVYEKPANRLVATFIGSPAMNIISGDLTTQTGQGPIFVRNHLHIPLPYAPLPKNSGLYLLGVRPEHIHIVVPGSKTLPGAEFNAQLMVKELHGHEIQVVAQADSQQIICRVADQAAMDYLLTVRHGNFIKLRLQEDKVHWFAPESPFSRVQAERNLH